LELTDALAGCTVHGKEIVIMSGSGGGVNMKPAQILRACTSTPGKTPLDGSSATGVMADPGVEKAENFLWT